MRKTSFYCFVTALHQEQGWTGFIRVDGHAYTFLGDPSLYGQSLAIQESYQVLDSSTLPVMSLSLIGLPLRSSYPQLAQSSASWLVQSRLTSPS